MFDILHHRAVNNYPLHLLEQYRGVSGVISDEAQPQTDSPAQPKPIFAIDKLHYPDGARKVRHEQHTVIIIEERRTAQVPQLRVHSRR